MQTSSFPRIATATLASVATLAGLAACGNKSGDSEATSLIPTATSTGNSTTSAATVSSAPTETETVSSTPQPTKDNTPAPASSSAAQAKPGSPAGPAGEQGLQPMQPAEGQVAPIDGGHPASQAEIDSITAMLRRPEQQTTMRGFMENMVNSTCQQLIDQNGGAESFRLNEFPDFQLRDLPEYQASRTTVTGVNNVLVNGATASADVTTAKSNGESQTSTMRFRNEGGDWKMCN